MEGRRKGERGEESRRHLVLISGPTTAIFLKMEPTLLSLSLSSPRARVGKGGLFPE